MGLNLVNLLTTIFLFWCGFACAGWEPDFLIIGAQKSGTTALYHFLNQHPLIVKKMDETHYFDHNFDKSTEWYRQQFSERPSSGHLIGDKSPYYIFHPQVPQRVFQLYPNVKILVILRNPVDRAYSQYWHNVRNKIETLTFEEALNLEHNRISGEFEKLVNDPWYKSPNYQRYSYQERGKYVDQLKRWFQYFSKDQILVITSDELKESTLETMTKVFTFLGIEPLQELIPFPAGHEPYPEMDQVLRKKLLRKFRFYNKALEELLGRQFTWVL